MGGLHIEFLEGDGAAVWVGKGPVINLTAEQVRQVINSLERMEDIYVDPAA